MSFLTIYPGGGTSAVNKLKSGKSGGPNRITTEHPKWGGETSSVVLGCDYSIIKLGKIPPNGLLCPV